MFGPTPVNRVSRQHDFSAVPQAEIQRSTFNRSHPVKTTFDASLLIPIFVDEALPGDTFDLKATLFGRLATPIVPIMDTLRLDTFFFSVPYRVLWENFKKFMGEQKNPTDSIDFVTPRIPDLTPTAGDIYHHMGLPLADLSSLRIQAVFFRAYNKIYNDFFRHQDLQDSLPENYGDGPDLYTDYKLVRVNKIHDYFSSALPFPQKGPSITLPLGDRAPILMINDFDGAVSPTWWANTGGAPVRMPQNPAEFLHVGADTKLVAPSGVPGATDQAIYNPEGTIYTDLGTATAAAINDIREAFQLQRWLERAARGGTRYTEIIFSMFNVTSPDSRQQRPEYLGGGKTFININPVAQTGSTDTTSPQGNLAAYGTVVTDARENGFVKSFTEHSVVIGLACVRSESKYSSGVPRMFTRETRFDFPWPTFAHLGEQEIYNYEIDANHDPEDLSKPFGFQERYAELRYKPAHVSGLQDPAAPLSLAIWNLTEKFSDPPNLNAFFMVDKTREILQRCLAVNDQPQIILDGWMEYKCTRPIPTYSVPGMIDHF